jgi:PilZ domain
MATATVRRSERLLITVPIRVEGLDSSGDKFIENTRTLIINRHGARIRLKRLVKPGAMLKIVTLIGNRNAEFRVVGRTQPMSDQGSEWGVECMDNKLNIWAIDFPPPQDGDGECSGLLECRRCHTVALSPLSLVEHDVLATSGLLTKECKTCGQASTWGYSEKQVAIPVPGQEAEPSIREVMEPPPPSSNRRNHGRPALRLPIRVRNYYGMEEMAKSENISKGGLAFMSDKNYEIGEGLQVTCPYDPAGHNIEVRARVVRRREMKGSGRTVYGVRYEKEPNPGSAS